jgi:hypothetical protein
VVAPMRYCCQEKNEENFSWLPIWVWDGGTGKTIPASAHQEQKSQSGRI